jgi:hypothetical protein
MKFYVVQNPEGETVGCESTMAKARALIREIAAKDETGEWCVVTIDARVTAATISRLLAQTGGFAHSVKHTYIRPQEA